MKEQVTGHKHGLLDNLKHLGEAVFHSNHANGKAKHAETAVARPAGREWVATISSTAPTLGFDQIGNNLSIVVVDIDGNKSAAESTQHWESFNYGDDGADGWVRRWTLSIPKSMKKPAAVLINKLGPDPAEPGPKDTDPKDQFFGNDYIRCIKIATEEGVHQFTAHSWVAHAHGPRIFFEGTPCLPQNTPPALLKMRKNELENLRGKNGPGPKENGRWDRRYGYQVYDDLGSDTLPRPTLGGTAQLPYPRHMTNSLATGAKWPGTPWIPFDDEFDFSKVQGFNGASFNALIPSVVQGLEAKLRRDEFQSFDDVKRMYIEEQDDAVTSVKDDGAAPLDSTMDPGTLHDLEEKVGQDRLGPLGQLESDLVQRLGNAKLRLHDALKGFPDLKKLLQFPVPRVLAHNNRNLEDVFKDEEWGRQCVAGVNPSTIQALKALATLGSAIGPQHVDKELAELGAPGGLEQLVADAAAGEKPRLFLIDYSVLDALWGEEEVAANGRTNGSAKPDQRCEHAGRALLFLQQDKDGKETAMIPIAFELKHRQTAAAGSAGVVYARQQLKNDKPGQALWWLAKTIFRSLDASYHQLISHWLRCHACSEPYLLALRRQISAMHPVWKLMLPHFRFNMDINKRARMQLVNAGGVVEQTFTAGAYAMRLSAVVYKSWRFVEQAPPVDLAKRGMLKAPPVILAKRGMPKSKDNLWLQSYPYAEDGLQIWDELTTYFAEYLSLYYKNDEDVKRDEELQAWWREVKDEGHGDLKLLPGYDEATVWGFAGPIPGVEKLTEVLATIAWITSAHHAAVNFPQYDYIGLPLNMPLLIRRPIPRPNDDADPAYKALASKSGVDLEREKLSYLAAPKEALAGILTVSLLSTHAEGEETLDDPNALLTDPAAIDANTRFRERMQVLEASFASRNADPVAWSRYGGDKTAMPYTQLIPPCMAPGITLRGVPYSVSI